MKSKQKTPRFVQSYGVISKTNYNVNDISILAQRQRLLAELQIKPVTTIQARSKLNILAPAARIWELRHKLGYNIATSWINDVTKEGYSHRVAKYALLADREGL